MHSFCSWIKLCMSSSAELRNWSFFNKIGIWIVDVPGNVRKEKLVIQWNESILCKICDESTLQHDVRSIHILPILRCVVFWISWLLVIKEPPGNFNHRDLVTDGLGKILIHVWYSSAGVNQHCCLGFGNTVEICTKRLPGSACLNDPLFF